MTIDDWYKGNEDEGWDAPGRDWLDDDRPDRSVDSWLEQAREPGDPSLPGVRALDAGGPSTDSQARRTPKRDSPAREASQSKRSKRPPTWNQILQAVHEELSVHPGYGPEALFGALQRRGGSLAKIRLVDVQDALTSIASGARPRRRTSVPASPPPARQQKPGRGFSDDRPGFNQAVFKLVEAKSTRGVAEIGERLRERGWQGFAHQDVMSAWRQARSNLPKLSRDPKPARHHIFQGLSLDGTALARGSASRGAGYPARSARGAVRPRRAAVIEVCVSCGGPIAQTGVCRCSS